jgi:hypothetical protein
MRMGSKTPGLRIVEGTPYGAIETGILASLSEPVLRRPELPCNSGTD